MSECKAETISQRGEEGNDSSGRQSISECSEKNHPKEVVQHSNETQIHKAQSWSQIRPSLGAIENMMSSRVQKRRNVVDEQETVSGDYLPCIEEAEFSREASQQELENVQEKSVDIANAERVETTGVDGVSPKHLFPWIEELESLVRGGVPKDLRGEVWFNTVAFI